MTEKRLYNCFAKCNSIITMGNKSVFIATRVPKNVAEKIREAINDGQYMSVADFLRVATRSELAKNSFNENGRYK